MLKIKLGFPVSSRFVVIAFIISAGSLTSCTLLDAYASTTTVPTGVPVTMSMPAISAPSNNILRNSILTLQAVKIFPEDGKVLTDFPSSLKVLVTRGGQPEQGVTVQFYFGEHNAYLTTTDLSGFAYLTILNPSTLFPGFYTWHATAIKTGLRGASTSSSSFIISSTNEDLSSGSNVSTNQQTYHIGLGKKINVKIFGNVNSYDLGDAIVLKIISPSKITQLVAWGTYLGAFQANYTLGDNSEVGVYTVTAFHKYGIFSSATFSVVRDSS